MNTKNIDVINIGLVLLSLYISITIPFELFLFSYTILGPIHYLTEINWLKDNDYFIYSKPKWYLVFFTLTILLSIYPLSLYFVTNQQSSILQVTRVFGEKINSFLLIGFLFAFCLMFFKQNLKIIIALSILTLGSLLLPKFLPDFFIFIGIFLPTIVHVYFFTIVFVLFGAIKSKSKYGIYLSVLLLIVPWFIAFWPLNFNAYKPSNKIVHFFLDSNFSSLGTYIGQKINVLENGNFKILSNLGLRIQVFITFSYTYHYLNWFSKTSIIGWKNNLSKLKCLMILIFWILSVALYIYDFKTGFTALFVLSFLHVFLEFPLNALSIKELSKYLIKRIRFHKI